MHRRDSSIYECAQRPAHNHPRSDRLFSVLCNCHLLIVLYVPNRLQVQMPPEVRQQRDARVRPHHSHRKLRTYNGHMSGEGTSTAAVQVRRVQNEFEVR